MPGKLSTLKGCGSRSLGDGWSVMTSAAKQNFADAVARDLKWTKLQTYLLKKKKKDFYGYLRHNAIITIETINYIENTYGKHGCTWTQSPISIIFSVNNDSYSHIIFATEKVFALS